MTTLPIQAPPRRVKRLLVAADLILHWWKGMDGKPRPVRQTGIPADAKVVGVAAQSGTGGGLAPNVIVLLVESAEFPPVDDGSLVPELDVEFSEAYP